MKKFLFFIAALAASSVAQAQTEWGVKAGVDFTNYNLSVQGVNLHISPGTKTGFFVGAVNNTWFCDKVGLQTELMYNYNGPRFAVSSDIVFVTDFPEFDEGGYGKVRAGFGFHTLRLPVMIKFRPVQGLSIMAGPYLSMRIATGVRLNDGAERLFEYMESNISDLKEMVRDILNDSVQRFDLGATMGVEYAFKCGFFIDARYNISLLNLFTKEESNPEGTDIHPTLHYSAMQIGLGFRF